MPSPGSMPASSAAATWPMAPPVAMGRPSVCERVCRERSLNLTFTVTVRAAVDAPRSMVATDSAMRSTWRSSSCGSTRSWLKVSSCPIDLLGRFGLTGSGSSPRASAARWAPLALPSRRTSVSSGRAARSPTVRTPRSCRRFAVAGPTPQSASTSWACRNSSSSAGSTRKTPGPGSSPARLARGFAAREASLAIILERPMPTAQPSPSSSRTRRRRSVRDLGGRPEQAHRAGHVHERLVEADRLHHRRDVAQDLVQLCAHLGVAAVAPRQEDGVGAELAGPHGRHGRVHAVGAGLVGARGHHAAGAGPAHDHRLAGQRGVVEHLDRREERVHVDVEDGRDRRSLRWRLRHRGSTGGTPRRRPRRPSGPPRPPGGAPPRPPSRSGRRTGSGGTRRPPPWSRWCR